MSIIISDPYVFLTSQGGVIGTPLLEAGAGGAENLDVPQRGAVIGEPIPLVFCRRVDGIGGVLISPAATEARFDDDAMSNITANYHLVLSEGEIDSIQVRDVFQRSCRVGSFTQTYDKRAGTFIPGNFINNTPNLEAPAYCGTGGRYTGLSTMAFSVTIPAGFDQWNRQVHCFVRGGFHVQRLLDGMTGPSNNVADLLLHLFRVSSRVPENQIDTNSLIAAARFTHANGFFFNGELKLSTNLRDWSSDTLQYFMLRQSRINGKEALRALLPTNADGTIDTGPVDYVFTLTERHVIPETFEITYSSLADRKPFCVTVLWRQQDDLGIPVMRTTEVRYAGTAIDGPFEQHDLTAFCASENHAIKAGSYILSKRNHITHRVRISVRPDAYSATLASGDLVRLRLIRRPSNGLPSVHDYIYEVDRIGKSITGEVRLDLTHFPVNSNLASVVANEVVAAVGSGLLLPTGLTGITCDINDSDDLTIPIDTSLDPSEWDLPPLDLFELDMLEIPEFGSISNIGEIEQLDELDYIGNIDPIEGLDGIGSIGGIKGIEELGEIESFGDTDGFEGFGISDPPLNIGSNLNLGLEVNPEIDNPLNPLGGAAPPERCFEGGTGPEESLKEGDTLTYEPGCENPITTWYLVDTATGLETQVSSGVAAPYIVTSAAVAAGVTVYAVGSCPDPSAPAGYGDEIRSCTEAVFEPDGVAPFYASGEVGAFEYTIDVGDGLGTFLFSFDGGGGIADTFTISGAATFTVYTAFSDTVTITKTSPSRFITVSVAAPDSGTVWLFNVQPLVPA